MLVWLTRLYLSFNALLIECHKYFHLAWENNHAVSAKQRSSCKDVYRVHVNSKVWPLLNFRERQTEEFPHFILLSKNPLKLNKSKMNHIILIILCRNGGNISLHQLSSENQYNFTPLAKLLARSSQLGIKNRKLLSVNCLKIKLNHQIMKGNGFYAFLI